MSTDVLLSLIHEIWGLALRARAENDSLREQIATLKKQLQDKQNGEPSSTT